MAATITQSITVPDRSELTARDYERFLRDAWKLFAPYPQYLTSGEDINCLELAHVLPAVAETVLAIYLGINDAVCNKGLITPFLPRHGHNNVFAFDPNIYPGGKEVPPGTVDARELLVGFEPPNETWNPKWTYVMIEDPDRSFESLWQEKGYIDMVPAKFEDFTMLSDPAQSKVCLFIDAKAFDHPANTGREYLKEARDRGDRKAAEFEIPKGIEGEMDGLAPVILNRGEKLYVATPDFGPCEHGWSNLHPKNRELAVVNENSAVPLDLVIAKPPVSSEYAAGLIPPKGSADMTTDWFFRGKKVSRTPILEGAIQG